MAKVNFVVELLELVCLASVFICLWKINKKL